MPQFKKPQTTRLYLPSTDGDTDEDKAWVEVRTKVLLGDIVAAREETDGTLFKTGLAMLSRLIVNWNYTDEDNKPIPITVEALNHLEKVDYDFLDKWLSEHLPSQEEGLATEEKKGSTPTSIPVSTDEGPPSNPQPTS